MPYVRRNPSGLIDSLHRSASGSGADEFLPDEHPEVQAFVGNRDAAAADEARTFDRLDADFVRVLEDLIDTLNVKNVVNITDLPAGAQAKLLARKSFRERASRSALQLFDRPSEFGDVI
jgi:hypothetical protein